MSKIEQRIIFILAATVFILLIAVLLIGKDKDKSNIIAGSFSPPDFDKAAVVGTPIEAKSMSNYGTLNIAKGFIVSMCSSLSNINEKAEIWFTSNADNSVWVKLCIFDTDGNLLGESGLLKPGEYVQYIDIKNVPTNSEYVVAKILSYEPDTYYSLGSATAQINLTTN